MSTGGAGLPLKIIAALLLVLVVLRGLTLLDLAAADRELDRIEEAREVAPATRMTWLDDVTRRNISATQSERIEALRGLVSRDLVLGAATLVWPDRSRLALADGLRAPIGAPREGRPRLVLDEAALGRPLTKLAIDGTTIELAEGGVDLPVALDSETPNCRVEVSVELDAAPRHDFRLTFLRDLNAPQLELLAGDRGAVEAEGTILGLTPGEDLRIKLQDGTLMRRIRVRLDGRIVLDRANTRTLTAEVFRLDPAAGEGPFALEVEAADWSGNVLQAGLEVRPLEPTAPRLVGARLGVLDLLRTTQRSRARRGEIELEISGSPRDGRIHASCGGIEAALETTGENSRLQLPYEVAAGEHELAVAIWIERYGRRVDLGHFKLRHDDQPPRIDLFDDQDDPVLVDGLSISGKRSFRLEIKDDDQLDAGREMTSREGALRLEAARKEPGRYRQVVHVDGPGRLLVTARDLAGNEARREFRFDLKKALGPDDGRGPAIALLTGAKPIDPATDCFFWKESGDLRLLIEDAGGLDPATLELERIEPRGGLPSEPESVLDIPVRIEADPTVEIADSHGNRTRLAWSVVILSGPATLEAETGAGPIATLPTAVKWSLKDVVPAKALRARLRGPDDREVEIEIQGNRMAIDAEAAPRNGSYRVALELITPRGPVTIASIDLEIAIDRAAGGGGN